MSEPFVLEAAALAALLMGLACCLVKAAERGLLGAGELAGVTGLYLGVVLSGRGVMLLLLPGWTGRVSRLDWLFPLKGRYLRALPLAVGAALFLAAAAALHPILDPPVRHFRCF